MSFHRMLTISYGRRLSFSLETIPYLVKFARSQSISMACMSHVVLFLCLNWATDYNLWNPKEKTDEKKTGKNVAETKQDKGLAKLCISLEVLEIDS